MNELTRLLLAFNDIMYPWGYIICIILLGIGLWSMFDSKPTKDEYQEAIEKDRADQEDRERYLKETRKESLSSIYMTSDELLISTIQASSVDTLILCLKKYHAGLYADSGIQDLEEKISMIEFELMWRLEELDYIPEDQKSSIRLYFESYY